MGVTGSHCQLCRLPLNHDHYVPDGGMFRIYRSSEPRGGALAAEPGTVAFGADHDWLCDVVALPRFGDPRVVEGKVEDGVLEDKSTGERLFIWDGNDEGLAYHHYCWELAGSPTTAAAAPTAAGTFEWSLVEAYDNQLFEWSELLTHGFEWMRVSPRRRDELGARSAGRIRTMVDLALVHPPAPRRPATVSDVLASRRGWRGVILRGDAREPRHVLHHRTSVHDQLDCAAYPYLVWAIKDYGAPDLPRDAASWQELAAFEAALVPAVERDGAAIVLMTTLGGGQTQYIVQARDEAATRAAIDALPAGPHTGPLEYDNEHDPAWQNFFDKLAPRRHSR